jgi:hypothetical protein
METMLSATCNHNDHYFNMLNSKMDSLLWKIEAAWTENTMLCEHYHASSEETVLLKAAVDTLMKTLNENIAISTPPSPETMTANLHSNAGYDDATILHPRQY